MNVLIIEDNPGDLRLVTELLGESGSPVFKTTHAGRLSAALEFLVKEVFHVVLLDLDLPDSSGLEGVEKLTAASPGTAVIVLTGRNDEAVGLQALQKRAADYLVKGQITAQLLARSINYAVERLRAENERRLTGDFLRLVNETTGTRSLIRAVAVFFQNQSGCQAVGIRLKDGDDYPYFEARGFPAEFIEAEYSLCARDAAGGAVRDGSGNPVIDCMCGNVICGRYDVSKPFFTGQGTFWTNSTTQLLAGTTEADRQSRTRNRCNGEGYESVALICLRAGCEPLGLLQLNDRRKGLFSPETIGLWERLAAQLAIALSKSLAEEAQAVSEQGYRSLFNKMSEGFALHEIITDGQGRPVDYRFLEVNPSFERLTGLKNAEISGRLVSAVLPGIESFWIETYGKVALTGEPANFEQYYPAPLDRWYQLVSYRPGPARFAVLVRDITERKKKEAELHKLNRLLKARNKSDQAMLHAENEQDYLQKICGIIVEDCGHPFVWIGFAEQDEARSVRPVAQAGFEAGYLKELKLTWADTERGRGPTGTVIRTGKPGGCKNMRTDPAFAPWRGEALKRGYASSLVLPLLAGGQAFGALTIYSKQTDDFAQEEVKLLAGLADELSYGLRTLRLRAAHKLSEEDVQRIAHIGVWEIDLATGALTWSTELYRICEADPEKSDASFATFLSAVHPEDRELVAEAYMASIKNVAPYDITHRLLMKDGRVKHLRGHSKISYDSDGHPLRSVGILHDITDHKRSEDGLMAAQIELERAKRLSDIGTLAATVAHELRNPLATIGMAAVNIKRKAKNPDLDKHLANIDKKVFESNQIINNLLFYSRLKPPHYERVGIHDILEEAIETARERFANGIHFSRDINGLREVFAEADPIQLKEVLNNILNNAGDAIPAGGGKIEVSGVQENGFISIAVKDSGPGIDKDILDRVFDPFFTTKAKGTGLGLSVCRQIMDYHGGSIELRSVPGRGTAANIRLPVSRHGGPAAQL